MTRILLSCRVLIFLGLSWLASPASAAETGPAATTAAPTLEQRVAGLEAYLANRAPVDAPVATLPGPGHNAWMMTSTLLVLFMTLPGLALFYGGLVRTKNVLSIMAWCLGITSLVSVLWWAVGYSLVFGKNFHSPFIGGSEYFFFRGVTGAPNGDYSAWVSHNVFAMFQLMFAIITPAVIVGAVVERMRFSAVLLFVTCWMLLVYVPLAHMVWGSTGLMNGLGNPAASVKAIDFAGGFVVEMASGYSALVLCLFVGPRRGYGRTPMPPHSMVLCMTGAGLLWVGWYGFNAGSAVAADAVAANAFTSTTLTAAVAAGTWAVLEYFYRGKASVLGFCSGAVAGLVAVTPACGFIGSGAAILLGLLGGGLSFLACTRVKARFGYDDALDVFGVHGVGGTVGALFTGFFARAAINPGLNANLHALAGRTLWVQQLKAMGITVLLTAGTTALIAYALKTWIGLRAAPEAEMQGLDEIEHGEQGYIYDASSI